jgi:hypothetical protein
MKLEFYQKKKKKSVYIKFHENPSCGSRVVPCGRTDEANNLFPHAKAPKMHSSDPSINSSNRIVGKIEMVFEPYHMLFKNLKRGRRGGEGNRSRYPTQKKKPRAPRRRALFS